MSSSKKPRNKKDKYQHKLKADGTPNPKYIDLLDEDEAISGQKFACVSFVSPENLIKQREMFYFEEFLKSWDINKSMSKFVDFLNFVAYKYKINFDKVSADFQTFVQEEQEKIYKSEMNDDYKTFVDKEEERLLEDFSRKHKFQTSVRGVKIRGTFPTLEEAEFRCKMIQENDPNHDVFVGPVGVWMLFHPTAYKTGRTEYLDDELNQLMHEKNKNEKAAKREFDKRRLESKEKAMSENQKKSEKFGCKLTQTIDENGNLVSISNTNTQEEKLKSTEMTMEDIRKELFEGDDVIMNRKTDGGYSRLPDETKALLKKNEFYNADEDPNDDDDFERDEA
jgi:hypothetical protein